MKANRALFLFCIAGIVTANVQAAPKSQPLYWYNGDIKRDIYSHPDLCAGIVPRNQHDGAQNLQAAGHSAKLGQQGMWHIYPQTATTAAHADQANKNCLPFYSTRQKWENSPIYVQAPGVLVVFKSNLPVQEATQWLEAKISGKYKYRKQSIARAYLIEDVSGIEAIKLSAEIYESGKAEIAQPNWAIEASLN
jgi:hypothetical protein